MDASPDVASTATLWHIAMPGAEAVHHIRSGMTQFGRALSELNIEILRANCRQVKGRIERMNRTVQDQLVKELRLADIGDVETGNAFFLAAWSTTESAAKKEACDS
ncbi:hypothetical protein CUJ84_pRLN3000387 (plasmid) [Rhizobium leguminosarum]|uniref:Transposase n=1 Tax=Rhizobium leguminosarum TaxID=384 RepID=A0A2K9ZGW5_RHILE|nr:hypothetical protein CUJ84_pRLN3000387 [Rhizobium leguminosarum]